MSIREYWAAMWVAIKKSWTMYGAAVFVVLGVIELNLALFKPFVSGQAYAIATIFVASILGIARLRGLSKDVKAGR